MSSSTSSRTRHLSDLTGKRAVVTGSASGIGRATAEALAREGARVAGLDLLTSDTEVAIVGDTSDAATVERAADALGGVDIWVNNAARLFVRPLVETTDEEWHALLGPNLHGYFYGCRAAARRMLAQGTGGRIVNVTSAVNVLAVPELSAYGAAKGAIASLTKALALELAPAGITVNAVAPGAVETPLNADAYTPEVRRTYEQRIPLGRIGTPDEVADTIVFLASEAARYVTGQELLVDGGLTINGSVGHARDELATGLDHPEGVCWDPDADVLYAGGELGQLYRVSLDGDVEEVARLPQHALGLAVDGRGGVFACCQDAGVWRWDGDGVSQVADGFAFANYPAFGADGTLYVSDSGGWGANDGCVRAGGEVLSRDAPHFTNGLAVSPDGKSLWVAESYEPRVGRIDLANGGYEEIVRIDGTVPDGLAFDDAGGVLVSCYRPDRIYRLDAAGELSVVAEDPQGTLFAAPTNVCFAGAELDRIVCANFARRHLTVIDDTGLRGAPLQRP